jgi:hypothetical protein
LLHKPKGVLIIEGDLLRYNVVPNNIF